MTEHNVAVTITRVPISTPCPVRVTPDGKTLNAQNEPLPIEERTEWCAVDASWMLGMQRVCDCHLIEVFDKMNAIQGTFDELMHETFAGQLSEKEIGLAISEARRPWFLRKRATQAQAQKWHDAATAAGGA